MIRVQRLTFTYPGSKVPAVDSVDFEIERGRIFGFLGPNGAGKSTVQNIMTRLLPVQGGAVLYEGKRVEDLGKAFFNRVGVSFEHPNLYERLTGLENLRYYRGLFSGPSLEPERALEMVGLEGAGNKRAGQYSKGMKQRLVFARAIMNRPDFLFLDEPTSGMDPGTARNIKEIIMGQKDRGATVFLTTHNMFVAEELADTVAFLNEGRIVAQDSPRNLKLAHGQKAVKVEYQVDDKVKAETLFLDKDEDRARLGKLVDSGGVETMHSQEASLEQIFIRLTGRGLS
ncbi:MAG: ABC transporter ATP-binding protein [Bacillota bacterium]